MGKKVESLKIESMNQAQSSEFHTTNIARAEADPVIAEQLAPQLAAWKQANTQFDAYLKTAQRQLLTEDIKDLDATQDDDVTAFRGMVNALQNIPDAAKKESARRVKLCMDTYKIETQWEYIKEMNLIRQMLDDLQGRYAADVAALGLGIFVEKLAASNAAVRQAQLQREDDNAGTVTGQTVAWRRETEKKYRDFVEMLNARTLVFGDADYVPFIDKLNASIAHYRQILAVAAGIRAAKKDKEEGGSSESSSSSSHSSSNSNVTPIPASDNGQNTQTGDNTGNNGQQTGDNTGNNGQQTGDNTGNNGQQTGDNTGNNGNDNPGGDNTGDDNNDTPPDGGDINDGGLDD